MESVTREQVMNMLLLYATLSPESRQEAREQIDVYPFHDMLVAVEGIIQKEGRYINEERFVRAGRTVNGIVEAGFHDNYAE